MLIKLTFFARSLSFSYKLAIKVEGSSRNIFISRLLGQFTSSKRAANPFFYFLPVVNGSYQTLEENPDPESGHTDIRLNISIKRKTPLKTKITGYCFINIFTFFYPFSFYIDKNTFVVILLRCAV